MTRHMLDTNTVSDLFKRHPNVTRRVVAAPMAYLCISAITEGEIQFSLAKRPDAKRLHLVAKEFLRRVDVLPWNSNAAKHYGRLRFVLESQGKMLAPLDLLIAAHALSAAAVLVTNDRAFNRISDLTVEDWSSLSA